jgi:D,D-heptose 1,7-bisphosphate phosphatase
MFIPRLDPALRKEDNVPRRIAMISEHASPLGSLGGADSGGQNVYVAQVAVHLARQGDQVEVFTRREDPEIAEAVECEGFRVVHVPAGPPQRIRKEELLPYMPQFTEWMLNYCRRKNRFDCIHANFWMSALVGADLQTALGIPLIVTFHALGKVRRQFQGAADGFPDERFAIEERVMREAVRIIPECPQDEEDQVLLYGADRQKMRIVPCGFDAVEFWPLDKAECRRKLGLPVDVPIVLQLGRMVERKGIDNVVRAMAILRRQYHRQARLIVVGGESDDPDPTVTPEIGRLQRIAAEENATDLVTFVGRRGRQMLRFFYNAADVFVTTPWYEPFGITPLEAMACGTPVIGSNVGGIKYTVSDGETGFLVPPRDPDALAAKLALLFSQSGLRRAMGRQAIRRANNYFTWRKVAQAISHVYDEAIAETRPIETTNGHASRGSRVLSNAPRYSGRRQHSTITLRPAIFLDKDGTVVRDVPYNADPTLIELAPGAVEGLRALSAAGYGLIVISNQSGVAHGYFAEPALDGVERRLQELLSEHGIRLDAFYYCPHHPNAAIERYRQVCECRKPAPGLVLRAASEHRIDLARSWFIGDILTDVEAGRRAGCRTALIDNGNETLWHFSPDRMPDVFAADLADAATMILGDRYTPFESSFAVAVSSLGENL